MDKAIKMTYIQQQGDFKFLTISAWLCSKSEEVLPYTRVCLLSVKLCAKQGTELRNTSLSTSSTTKSVMILGWDTHKMMIPDTSLPTMICNNLNFEALRPAENQKNLESPKKFICSVSQ